MIGESSASLRGKPLVQVAHMEEVQRATEAAFAAVVEYLRSNEAPTSEEAREIIDRTLEVFGCESPEGSIVAGGAQSAAPHAPGSGVLRKGEQIVIDIYPRSKTTGYFADMSRTVCVGEPSPEVLKMFEAVLGAQELGISMLRPGVLCQKIQDAAEEFFITAGYITSGDGDPKEGFPFSEGFVHGVGHGVGLEVHEAPRIGRNTEDILQEGDVVTVEPGLYYKTLGGVRLEDMLLITKEGYRNLTKANKTFVL